MQLDVIEPDALGNAIDCIRIFVDKHPDAFDIGNFPTDPRGVTRLDVSATPIKKNEAEKIGSAFGGTLRDVRRLYAAYFYCNHVILPIKTGCR